MCQMGIIDIECYPAEYTGCLGWRRRNFENGSRSWLSLCDKDNNLRVTAKTIEYRFFRAAKTVEEASDFIEVADRITDYCKNLPEVTLSPKQFEEKTESESLASFKEAMELIGCPEFYEKYKIGIENRYRFVRENPSYEYLIKF